MYLQSGPRLDVVASRHLIQSSSPSNPPTSEPRVYSGARVAYIICEPCVGTKDTACVDVCPVDCIHPRKDEPAYEAAEMLFIHPDECIDCGACVPACPVEAIFALDEIPAKWKQYIPVNAQYYRQ